PHHTPNLHSFPTRRSSDLIDESGTRTSLLRAKAATILAATTELLANHRNRPRGLSFGMRFFAKPSIYDQWLNSSTASCDRTPVRDRKSTRLNSSHVSISYA